MARPSSRWTAATAAVVLSALLAGASAPARNVEFSGTILFASNRAADLDGEIYAIQSDGSRKRDLSRGPRLDQAATPSPDGRKIAFVSTRSGVLAIWVVNTDGSGLRQATGSLGIDINTATPTFAWAPDAKKIVYTGHGGKSLRTDVYVVNLASRRSRKIGSNGLAPTWSPDGSRIAYARSGSVNRIRVVRPNGRLLWETLGTDHYWSPDGGRIAITTTGAVLVATSRGRRLRVLKAESFVSWSPRGNAMIVRRGETLLILSLAGRGTRRLTHTDFAYWSPNGRFVVFGGKVGRREGLYILDSAQRKPRYLAKWTWVADWSPTSDALLVNADDALQTISLSGRTRMVIRASRASSFGGTGYWLRRNTIVYSSSPRWNPPVDLYRFSTTTRHVMRLTHAPFVAGEPTLSPDGRRIAFVRGLETADCKGICASEVYLADASGRHVQRLTHYRGADERFVSSPTWSPTGDRLAFLRSGAAGAMSIRTVSTNGGAEQVLISNSNDDFEYFDPAWSPDGRKISFASDRQDGGIFTMNPDGTDLTKLTAATGEDPPEDPAWSPDGSRIAFVDEKIYVMNVDGSGRSLVGTGAEPTWSPDGEWIAYESLARVGTALKNNEIYVIRPDGSQQRPVMTHPADEYSPSWGR